MKTIFKLLCIIAAISCSNAYAKDEDRAQKGVIDSISPSSVTVAGLTCEITSSTEFEGIADERLSFTDFKTGDFVQLHCRGNFAKELEKESNVRPTPTVSSTPSVGNDDSRHRSGDDSSSNSGKHSSRNENGLINRETVYERRLKASLGINTNSKGKAEYKFKAKGKDLRGSLNINVKVPVPSSVPLLSSADQADALNLTAVLERDGAVYGECQLEFDHFGEPSGNIIFAEYKLNIETKKGKFNSKKGLCDIDLTTAGIQEGWLKIKRKDLVTIKEVSSGGFLRAKF